MNISVLKKSILVLIMAISPGFPCVGDACMDDEESIFDCGPGIDYLWAGHWANDNEWTPYYLVNPALNKSQMTELNSEWRAVDWEFGDVHYRRIFGGGSQGEWHAEVLGPVIQYSAPVGYATVTGYPSVGCQGTNCLGDATIQKTYTLDQTDMRLPTYSLHANLENAQTSFSRIWGSEGNKLYRGSRYPSTYSLSVANKNTIISTNASVMNHDIDYTWADMLENKWDWYGNPDWDGSVGDIDEIRCDGVPEYSYERNGFRVWGGDSYWNSGSGNDDALDDHNDLWEHIGYNLGELSPVIQAGCGGYGDGDRTTLRNRNFASPPKIGSVTATIIKPDPLYPYTWYYRIGVSEIYDTESNKVYVTFQQYNPGNGTWEYVASPTASWIHRGWTGTAGVPLTVDAAYIRPSPGQMWRIVAIDEGGNSSIWPFSPEPLLTTVGGYDEYFFVADADGIFQFKLTGIPAGSDFDLNIYDETHGNVVIASGANGSNLDENLEFFAQKHTKIRFQVVCYSGSGTYRLMKNGFNRATKYEPERLYTLENASAELTTSLPASNGWAIAWGSNPTNGLDVDMHVLNPAGTVVASSTSTRPTEYIRGNFQSHKLSIFEYNPGTKTTFRVFKIE